MITVKTPVRISFLGGGSDIVSNVERKYGLVVGCTIQQYSYITARFLPSFFEYKTRLAYSKIETVNCNSDIEHNVIRAAIQYFHITDGIEITHIGDVPSKSGLGSSSSFLVALVNALAELIGKPYSKMDLYNWAVDIEQNILTETVGLQDTAWAALGGLASIQFNGVSSLNYSPIMLPSVHVDNLQRHILLFYTKISRVSSHVAQQYYPTVAQKELEMDSLTELAVDAINAIKQNDYEEVGRLVTESWKIKKSLHSNVSTPEIDSMISHIERCGGNAKLCGAGSGGSLLVFANPDQHDLIRAGLKHLVEIPVKIDHYGSRRIL